MADKNSPIEVDGGKERDTMEQDATGLPLLPPEVCKYFQQQSENSKCFSCRTSEDLLMCVICGSVGCGRSKEAHDKMHWKETEHRYSFELCTRRVWDYEGGGYLHLLLQSKIEGDLVKFSHHCTHDDDDSGGSCDCGADPGFEALMDSRVKALIANEYNELIATQSAAQKFHFESLIKNVEEETRSDIAADVEKALAQNERLLKKESELTKCIDEKKKCEGMIEMLSVKIEKLEKFEKKVTEGLEEKTADLQKMKQKHVQLEWGWD